MPPAWTTHGRLEVRPPSATAVPAQKPPDGIGVFALRTNDIYSHNLNTV
jgi:hypothetical protein